MEFKFPGIDTQKHYDYVFPTSSSSSSLNYSYFSDHSIIDGLYGGRLAREAPPIGVGFPPPLMLEQPLRTHHQFESEMRLHGEPYVTTVPMPYGGGGHHYRNIQGFETVAFRRSPPSSKMKVVVVYQPQDVQNDIIALGNPTGATVSGSKRKAPPPSSPTVAGSSGFCSKKITEEWRCALCDITATCERGLKDHLAGRKHQANMESLKCENNTSGDNHIDLRMIKTSVNKQASKVKSLKGNNIVGDIGLGVIKSSMKKQTSEIKNISTDSKKDKKVKMSDGGKIRNKYKFWCKTGAYDEVVMRGS